MTWIMRVVATATLCADGATLAALNGPALPAAVAASPVVDPPSAYGVTTSRTTDGLFHIDGSAGAGAVDFVVDTGASVTVLTAADARRLGAIPVAGARRTTILQTAGGQAAMAWRRVPALVVAGQRLGSVEVAVVGDGLRRSLLGQDVLARLGEIVIADDRLTIRATRR